MKYAFLLLALAGAVAPVRGQIPNRPAVTVPASSTLPGTPVRREVWRIAPQTFTELEKRFDTSLASTGGANDPIDLLGRTRGLYLDGYGAVFTTEVSLIVTPTLNPFRQTISKEEAARVHKRKLDRLPLLKQTMLEFMRTSSMTLVQIPDNQQFVVVVRLLYLPWEDTLGLPAQIVMKADRRSIQSGNIKTEDQ